MRVMQTDNEDNSKYVADKRRYFLANLTIKRGYNIA